MAQMADFRPTPASRKRFADLQLAARARLNLAFDPRTADGDLQVQADGGVVTVTYTPAQQEFAEAIPAVLAKLEGCQEIRCTMAETTILWIQERFSAKAQKPSVGGGPKPAPALAFSRKGRHASAGASSTYPER